MRRPATTWLAAACAAVLVAAEWARAPGVIVAAGLAILAAVLVWLALRDDVAEPWRVPTRAGAVVAAVAALLALVATWRLDRIEQHWPATREALLTGASRRLGGELEQAVNETRALAARAASVAALPPREAFGVLGAMLPGGDAARGVVLYDPNCVPRAWAGVQRVTIGADGPELSAITTPFYVWLVARRQTSAGTAAATLLLARGDNVPRAGSAVTDRFARATGVTLRFLPPHLAPRSTDVFDYVLPGPHGDTLFSVQSVPPTQEAAYGHTLESARRTLLVLAFLLLVAAASVASRAGLPLALQFLPGAVALAGVARAPLTQTFGAGSLFWPETYFQKILGPFSASAGALVVGGVMLFAATVALWRRGPRASRLGIAAAVVLVVVAPYLVQALARGIAPPPGGTSTPLWLTWQVALTLPASVIVLLGAALVRGRTPPARAGLGALLACALAVGAAVAGLWLWEPQAAWPDWYPYLWVPALALAIRPMPFRALLITLAIVAGSSAALLVWGATNDGRMALATRDLDALGDRADPVGVALLDRLVHETAVDEIPDSPGDLYLLWRRSALGAQGYPAALALWDTAGHRALSLDLAVLDLPPAIPGAVAQEARAERLPMVRPVLRVPGLYGVAGIPLQGGQVLTVSVGPRSELVAPSRLALFLAGTSPAAEEPYALELAPPGGAPTHLALRGVTWRRDGWLLRGERVVDLPDGPHHAHATIDLRGPSALLQRGLLVLTCDLLVFALLWLGVEVAAGRTAPALRAWWPRGRRSVVLRLTVGLALFFVVPTVAFAVWSYGRLEDEFRGARELLVQRTLGDAAAEIAQEGPGVPLSDIAPRVGAELFYSKGGALSATSAPVLSDLGLADALVPGDVFARLAYGDELEAAAPQRAAPAPTLVGYRLVARADPEQASVLAAPEFLSDRALQRREADLGIAVLVAVVLGIVAALGLARIGARALAEPLEALRHAALGVADGVTPAVGARDVPVELEPIRDALAQAASDVEAGRHAQRVLAWGEMARQVAHEIKNPLTPIRLGIQHLLRLQGERPADVGAALPDTGQRILAEIDRLDGIARTFSRFALPGAEGGTAVDAVDLAAVVDDVLRLYRMGEGGGVSYQSAVEPGLRALARRDELVEVLVNLCENARDAGARVVVITAQPATGGVSIQARDDGRGIAPDVLPRIFEPRFSTTTSGSGLGLAIARRLVESWGGRIDVAETGPGGTTMRLDLLAARTPA